MRSNKTIQRRGRAGTGCGGSGPTPRGSISPNKMNRAAPYLFLAPSLAGLCVFVLVPFADAVRPQLYRRHGQPLRGVCELRLGAGQQRVPPGGGQYCALHRRVCAPAAVRQPAAGRGRARRKGRRPYF